MGFFFLNIATLCVLQLSLLAIARPSALPLSETITLKCQPNTQGYPIPLDIAKKSSFLKNSHGTSVLLGDNSDCEKGLPIVMTMY